MKETWNFTIIIWTKSFDLTEHVWTGLDFTKFFCVISIKVNFSVFYYEVGNTGNIRINPDIIVMFGRKVFMVY